MARTTFGFSQRIKRYGGSEIVANSGLSAINPFDGLPPLVTVEALELDIKYRMLDQAGMPAATSIRWTETLRDGFLNSILSSIRLTSPAVKKPIVDSYPLSELVRMNALNGDLPEWSAWPGVSPLTIAVTTAASFADLGRITVRIFFSSSDPVFGDTFAPQAWQLQGSSLQLTCGSLTVTDSASIVWAITGSTTEIAVNVVGNDDMSGIMYEVRFPTYQRTVSTELNNIVLDPGFYMSLYQMPPTPYTTNTPQALYEASAPTDNTYYYTRRCDGIDFGSQTQNIQTPAYLTRRYLDEYWAGNDPWRQENAQAAASGLQNRGRLYFAGIPLVWVPRNVPSKGELVVADARLDLDMAGFAAGTYTYYSTLIQNSLAMSRGGGAGSVPINAFPGGVPDVLLPYVRHRVTV